MADKLPSNGRYTGYARVSTADQNVDMQIRALIDFGVPEARIFTDHMTGSKMERPGLKRAFKVSRAGDVLVIWKIDRLGRSVRGVLDAIEWLEKEGIGLKFLTDGFDSQTPQGRMVMTMLLAMAELERNLISERTKEGIANAKARGKVFGAKHSILDNPKRLKRFTQLWAAGLIPGGGDGKLSGTQIIAEMNAADPKAKPIAGSQTYFNFKRSGFKGFVPPSDLPLSETDDADTDE